MKMRSLLLGSIAAGCIAAPHAFADDVMHSNPDAFMSHGVLGAEIALAIISGPPGDIDTIDSIFDFGNAAELIAVGGTMFRIDPLDEPDEFAENFVDFDASVVLYPPATVPSVRTNAYKTALAYPIPDNLMQQRLDHKPMGAGAYARTAAVDDGWFDEMRSGTEIVRRGTWPALS